MSGYYNAEGYPDPTAAEAVAMTVKTDKWCKAKFRPFVYICSRYSPNGIHTVEENEADAVRYARFAIERGYIPLVSHLLWTRILRDDNSKERNLGLFFASVFLDLAKEIWIFSDEPYSKGMYGEYRRAVKRGYRIRYFSENLKEVDHDWQTGREV